MLLIFKFLRPKKSQDGSSSKLVIVIKNGEKKKNYTNRYSEYVLKNIFFSFVDRRHVKWKILLSNNIIIREWPLMNTVKMETIAGPDIVEAKKFFQVPE